ncbi:uncharacterized protein [Amphiura filiformis]|uniref:uncharacterized protein n=1 Tax=Amphiura filiformis TaxID=82378 RepID=UPI003B20EC00
MEPVKQFVVEGPSGEEMSSFQPGIHPTSLEFNFAQQPIIQPSPVQNVISILEKYLEEKDDKVSQSRHEVHVEKTSFGNNIKDLDESSADGQVENQDSLLAGNKSDIERTSSSVESDTNANFKYVMVDKNGAPDWSKVLHLDKNIIQEVCKKHGVNLDGMTSGKAEGKSGKKPKKKKKSKKSKTEKKSGQQDKNIPCTLCDKTFQSKRHLRDHMRYHTGKKLHCLDCDYVTVRQQQLDYHMNTHTGKRPFVCDVCNKGFRHHTGLSCHKKTHRGHTGAVSCDVCKMEFEQPHQLDRHMQTHKEERPHQCGFCTNNFKRAMDLRQHIKFYHSEIADKVDQIVPKESTPPEPEGDFKCRQCDRSFKTTQGLEQHKRRTHNSDVKRKNLLVKCRDGEQKYACQRCQKQFNSRKALINHRFTHTTVRPYTCTICGRSFKRQWELHKHKMTHTQQPSVPCTQCDAQFPGRGNLRRHMMRMHSDSKKTTLKPYRCEICLRAYARKPELAEHQNIHTGDRPYMCDTCGKTFSFRSALACHKKLHEVEAPYCVIFVARDLGAGY